MTYILSDDYRDRIGSALAINCCQFGFFLQKHPRSGCDVHEHKGWMGKLTDLDPEKKLRDTVIPGTHDSASVTISKWSLFSGVGICQNITIREQLHRGARYLDVRIGGNPESKSVQDVFICHGILKGGVYARIIDEIDEFITEYSGEFVILEVTYESDHKMSPEQRVGVFRLISDKFGDRIISNDDLKSWFRLQKVTLGDIKRRSKNLLLLIHDRICGFSCNGCVYDDCTVANDFNCHKNARLMKNKWHNTQCTTQLLENNEKFLRDNAQSEDFIVNSQFVLTPMPPSGASDALRLLCGVHSLRPVSLVRQLYKKDVLERFLRDRAEENWNVVTLDFINLCTQLCGFLIGLNSPRVLKIIESIVSSQDGKHVDVTKIMNSLVKRGSTLFVLDFQQDLKLEFCEGIFTLKYRFDNDKSELVNVPFDAHSELFVCDSKLYGV
eukprot:CCRYP_019481-RA/>CCRYP_019481-RA protein AED:0.04 eAED:0.04 QI:278/1/1/1/1/1/3/160/439